jgi:RNA polymerase sigma-70 factor (ECF subfamily)
MRMSKFNFPLAGKGKGREMFFSKSIALDSEELGNVALVTDSSSARSSARIGFIDKLKAGDAAAFDALVTRYAGEIYALLFRITEDAEEAGDLTQETFLSALKAIKKFRGEADLKTWLFRIAINESRNRFRWWKRRRREKTISLDAPIGASETPLGETFSSDSKNPEENILQLERESFLRKALNDLPETFREAVILCDIEEMSYEEIASILDINLGTVKSRIARGREELRKKLRDF